MSEESTIYLKMKYVKALLVFVLKRFSQNRCSSIAAELTVTSLLALVPLTTVVFALLAFLPSFQSLGGELQTLMFKYFVPGTGDTVQSYINEFVGKARGLSGIGSIMLLVTALLMMRTIDSSFNKIWQVKSNHSLVRTFLVYWAILTLGPILLGSSLLITSYIQSLPAISSVVTESQLNAAQWLPFVMATITFSVMFYVIPNKKIPLTHALFSGLLTGLLFELAKTGFAIFVTSFSTYQLIFGALAAVPLFLIWIYLCWSIVLLGAEFCHGLGTFEVVHEQKNQHPLISLISILHKLAAFQLRGETCDEKELVRDSFDIHLTVSTIWLEKLVTAGLVAKSQENNYCLIKSAEKINYLTLFEIAGRKFPPTQVINESKLPKNIKILLLSVNNNIENMLSGHLEVL